MPLTLDGCRNAPKSAPPATPAQQLTKELLSGGGSKRTTDDGEGLDGDDVVDGGDAGEGEGDGDASPTAAKAEEAPVLAPAPAPPPPVPVTVRLHRLQPRALLPGCLSHILSPVRCLHPAALLLYALHAHPSFTHQPPPFPLLPRRRPAAAPASACASQATSLM